MATTGAVLNIEFEEGIYAYNSVQNRYAIPMFAIWAEDLSGNVLQNIYISNYPATSCPRGATTPHPRKAGLPYWMHKAGNEVEPGVFLSDPDNNVPSDLDAVSGATCKSKHNVISRIKPNPADNNQVKILFEIQQAWNYSWYFVYGVNCYTEGESSLVYALVIDLETPGQYALGGTESGVNPVGYTHPRGYDGVLYREFYKIDPSDNQLKYIFEHAHKMTKRLMVTVENINPGVNRVDIDRKIGDFKKGNATEQEVKELINEYMETN